MYRPRTNARLTLLGATIVALLMAVPAMAQSGSHAGHSAHSPAARPTTGPTTGQRWATDAPLRDGMARIRQAVGALDHLQHGHAPPALAPTLAGQIQSAVNDMIASCKLAPDADAALHGLLVKFIAGAEAVRTGPVTPDTLKPMQAALAQYPVLFDDPTWNAASAH
ncbi:DnrO protein [Lysobacter sp. LF1]|uniref:DnrO protein n=1 Tax=Lysobacter stagni TaxID=3045172 RepID=A0ABT6XCW3_9GAMM|nr:DnrO protein [Lysobacter sp. LF1]MDI9237770.1 DnrO protein [Lysobacter sp. LF1]